MPACVLLTDVPSCMSWGLGMHAIPAAIAAAHSPCWPHLPAGKAAAGGLQLPGLGKPQASSTSRSSASLRLRLPGTGSRLGMPLAGAEHDDDTGAAEDVVAQGGSQEEEEEEEHAGAGLKLRLPAAQKPSRKPAAKPTAGAGLALSGALVLLTIASAVLLTCLMP